MSRPGPHSERALIFAPNGRDGDVAKLILREAGFPAETHVDLVGVCNEIDKGAGLAIIADEAIQGADLRPIADCLRKQPPWSDFPIILLTRHGGGPERNPEAGRLAEVLGNVTFLERPFHPTTFVSVIRTAVRGRWRQYETRKHLEDLASEREALADLTATLERRVEERNKELMTEVEARQRVQDQLLQSQKMESIGKLTGGVAHDFNNLLMAVMGNLELLRKRLPNDAGVRRLIEGAIQGAERGAALTQRMLAFARRQNLDRQSTDLGDLLTGMRELLERTLGPQIILHVTIAPDLQPAHVDANQVELAILNLAINARDAMPEGGNIDIHVGQNEAGGEVGLHSGNYVCVRITDTGSGMDEHTLKMAIEPFFSTKPMGKGTGLGLSMVHGLAVQLGGLLELSSTPGRGTTATLWLPVAPSPAATIRQVEDPPVPIRPATILVVDDDALIAMSTVDMLEDLGHNVMSANSGKRALEILDGGQEVDLLLTDQAMPGMTGTELAELARRRRPKLPILLATGYADLANDRMTNLPRLAKPYLQAQLRAEISRLLAKDQP